MAFVHLKNVAHMISDSAFFCKRQSSYHRKCNEIFLSISVILFIEGHFVL